MDFKVGLPQYFPMQPSLNMLPKRDRSTGKFVTSRRCYFTTNLYPVSFQQSFKKIYQYEIKHQYPDDSAQVLGMLIRSIRSQLKKEVGFISHSGNTLFGLAKIPNQISMEGFVKENSALVTLRLRKEIPVLQFLNHPDTRPMALQFLNSELKTNCKKSGMCEIGKIGKFFSKGQLDKTDQRKKALSDIGLNVLQGYQFTLIYLNHSLMLKVDACSRVLQRKSILQLMKQGLPTSQLIGSTIITRYGNYRTYKIQDILLNETPKTLFYNQGIGEEISYSQYYWKSYGMKIQNERQPLIKVVSRVKKEIVNQEIIATPIYIRLIPELVSPTGMTDAQRSEHFTMQALSPFTKYSPEERMARSGEAVHLLNNRSKIFQISYEPNIMEGHSLQPITIKTEHQMETIKDGRINLKRMKESVKLGKWFVAYSVGHNEHQDRGAIDNIINYLMEAGKRLNLTYGEPTFVEGYGKVGVEDWKEMFLEHIYKFGQPQLVMFLLKKHEAALYGKLKYFLLCQGIPSQFAHVNTFKKNGMSVASKVGVQMNIKLEGVPWEVATSNDYFRKKDCAFGGLATSKGKKGYAVSFVGSVNPAGTKHYSHYKVGVKRKEDIPNQFFIDSFYGWIKNFYKFSKRMPDVLLYYRQSAGNAQSKVQVQQEIQVLQEVIKKIKKSRKFQPEFVVMEVIKKGSTRFFQQEGQRIRNPAPGSVMNNLSEDDQFDFHLVPQYVNQGTCSPTHFKVLHETLEIPEQQLINFTYEQCYNYWNWWGSVKVPGVMQYAKKLATQAGEALEDLKDEKLKVTLHFL